MNKMFTRAHADGLAFRLDSGGASSLYVGATAARLCQAVTALQALMAMGGPAAAATGLLMPAVDRHRLFARALRQGTARTAHACSAREQPKSTEPKPRPSKIERYQKHARP
jgi:hypothetical protein